MLERSLPWQSCTSWLHSSGTLLPSSLEVRTKIISKIIKDKKRITIHYITSWFHLRFDLFQFFLFNSFLFSNYQAKHRIFVSVQNTFNAFRIKALKLYFVSVITYYISSGLFAVFGLKMLHEGYHMSATEGQEEYEEVNEELRKREEKDGKASLELGGGQKDISVLAFVGKIFIQAFTMTFLAEWGDRSQVATVILGKSRNYNKCAVV